MACLVGWWVAIVGVPGGWGGEEVAVGVWFGRAMRNPRRPPANSPELVRGRKGLLGGYSGLSPAFAAVGGLEGGRWSWGGVGGVAGGEKGGDCEGRGVALGGEEVRVGWWFGRAVGIPGVLRPAHRSWSGEGGDCWGS